MNIQTCKPLSRRHLLRGSMAAIGLPFLEAMLPSSTVSAATRKMKPLGASLGAHPRIIYIYHTAGVYMPSWKPKGEGSSFQLHGTLDVFKPFKDDMTVISGLANPLSTGGHAVGDTWLTCADLTRVPGKEYQNSISIDQVIANKIGNDTRYSSLQVSRKGGTGGANTAATVAFNERGIAIPCENRPDRLFDRLFTNPDSGSSEETKRRYARRRSLLDDSLNEAKNLRSRLGRSDQDKLDEYLEAVHAVENRVSRMESWVDKPKAELAIDKKAIETEASPNSEHDRDMWFDGMMDLAYLAFASDTSRVFTFGAEWGHGLAPNHHDYTHNGGDPEKITSLQSVDKWYADVVSRLVNLLKNTPEGNGSMLDNTLVVYGSGAGNTHQQWDLPMAIFGGKNLGVKSGQHIDHDPKKRTSIANAHLSIAQTFGVEMDQFADSTGTISGIV
jgi:hypothetical protein